MREWLKTMRTEQGMTMKDLSRKLGISESYYCAIENGERQKRMDLMLCHQLSVIFGKPVSEISEAEMRYRSMMPI
jgi:transcriptional regulator with XRE-family HTH domain|nr:MAG TPA: helix-turn-helix domain protein [Caudoviricetes sp.]